MSGDKPALRRGRLTDDEIAQLLRAIDEAEERRLKSLGPKPTTPKNEEAGNGR